MHPQTPRPSSLTPHDQQVIQQLHADYFRRVQALSVVRFPATDPVVGVDQHTAERQQQVEAMQERKDSFGLWLIGAVVLSIVAWAVIVWGIGLVLDVLTGGF